MTQAPKTNQYRPVSRAGLARYGKTSLGFFRFDDSWWFAVHDMSEGITKQRELFTFPIPEDQIPAFKDFLTHYLVLQRDVKRDMSLKGKPRTREKDYLDFAHRAVMRTWRGWKGRVRQECAREGIRAPTDWEFRKLAELLRRTPKT